MKKYISAFKYIIFLLINVAYVACNNAENLNNIEPANYSSPYFNFSNGVVITYQGDSIVYNDFNNSIDSISFQFKDSLIAIDSSMNQIDYHFERYISYDGLNYFYQKKYSINKSEIGIIRTEELLNNFILPFNFSKDSKWNGNQYQVAVEKTYFIDSIEKVSYASALRNTVRVVQIDEKNLIREDKEMEQYVEGIGMSYQYKRNVNIDFNTKNIKSGSIVILVHKP